MAGDLLNVEEAAAYLGLRPSTIRAWILQRRIRFAKLGSKAVRIQRADLDALIQRSMVQPRTVRQ